MSTDKSQDKYKEILREIKEEKMDWKFEDFLEQTEAKESPEKIIPITKEAKPLIPKFFWMAASVILLLGIFFLTRFFDQPSTVDEQNQLVQQEITKQKEDGLLIDNEYVVEEDSVLKKNKDSVVQNFETEKEAEEIMNKILPKRGRLKKNIKTRLASEEKHITENLRDEVYKVATENPEYQENFVVINGQKIYNEAEAIDVAKYSLQMLSSQISTTVSQADPLSDYTE